MVETGPLRIDLARRVVTVEGTEVHLTPTEYRIVALLAQHAGKMLTHRQILHEVWGPGATEAHYVRVQMAEIRRKLERDPARAEAARDGGVGGVPAARPDGVAVTRSRSAPRRTSENAVTTGPGEASPAGAHPVEAIVPAAPAYDEHHPSEVRRRAPAQEEAMERGQRMFAAMAVLAALLGCSPGEDTVAGTPPDAGDPGTVPDGGVTPPTEPALRVAFKLDPRLTTGVYMGDRWVSPPTYAAPAQTAPTFSVEARIESLPSGASGVVTWIPSDPEGVAVAPAGGSEVVITVVRPGASTLTVRVGESETVLEIEARLEDGTWRVTFRQ